MFIRVVQLLNPRKATGLFSIAVLILTGGLYAVFDSHLDSVGREIASSWLQSEAVAIQEGNLLSSISKNQRVLLSSQFIKGIKLVDSTRKTALIAFGEDYSEEVPSELEVGKFQSHVFGFLHRRIYFRLPERPDLVLSLQTHSDFLTRAFLATVAAFIALLTFLFVSIRRIESKRIEAENKNSILLGEVAARVAHDIRSPLSTLNAVLETVEGLPPNSRKLLTTAILRIREIGLGIADHSKLAMAESSSLKENQSNISSQTEPTLVAQLLEEVIDEKRIQYNARASDILLVVNPIARAKFASVNPNELRRSLSNLIDNSIEASTEGKPVKITLESLGQSIRIGIADHGCGIAEEHLSRIGDKGFTKNKPSGTGIGVHYAKRAVASWSGKIEYESVVARGTNVTIHLPSAPSPSWFLDDLRFDGYPTVVIVDDDPTIHSVWQERLATSSSPISVEHFFDAESAASWAIQNRDTVSKCLLLTDFNLNSRTGTGLTVLERFGLHHPAAVMVTNAFNDADLRRRCEKMNVKIMPKTMMDVATF
jgi:signal transduction histidine kinase